MSWSTSELRVRLSHCETGLCPPIKYFYWLFQGGASFVDLLCYFFLVFGYVFVRLCLLMPCGHLLGKGWPLGSCFWCLIVKLSFSHWYPGSGVVLDCIALFLTLIKRMNIYWFSPNWWKMMITVFSLKEKNTLSTLFRLFIYKYKSCEYNLKLEYQKAPMKG